jgi:hypothetical protein
MSNRENHGGEGYLSRKNYIFAGCGLVAEEIGMEYREERFLFGIGKFNPTFSYAMKNKYYGVEGTGIVSGYQLYEKLGFYVAMVLPIFNARVNFFRNDTTFLSRSLLKDRGTYNLKGDVGNVGDILKNFTVTMDFPILSGPRLNLGFRRLATSNSEKKPEFGYVAGLEFLFEETRDTIGAAPMVELVALHNHDGEPSKNTFFILTNIPLFYERWNFSVAWSAKIPKHDTKRRSQIFQCSIGYTFQNGITVDFSKKYERNYYNGSSGEIQKGKFSSWGVGLSYLLKFE